MSENSDAVVIVVSEETGQISVAMNGVLTRDYTRDKLKNLLDQGDIRPERALYPGQKALLLPFRKEEKGIDSLQKNQIKAGEGCSE